MPEDVLQKRSLNFYILRMATKTQYYYNPKQQIVRVEYRGKIFDLRAFPTYLNPNPLNQLVLALVPESVLEGEGISSDRLYFQPGYLDNQGTMASIPNGFCFFVDSKQKINTTNPSSGGSFSVSKTNTFDLDNVVVAISPYLQGRDYTSTEEAGKDLNNESIGFFINKDGTIVIKSQGASITMGSEGIHIGGKLFQESSAVETGPLSDNTIGDLIGSTIPTAAAAWPKLPNLGFISNIANASIKFMEIMDKSSEAIDIISNMAA